MPLTDEREQIISENLGLVHSVAHRFTGRGVEYDDLFGTGCIGLIKAYDGFDKSLGYRFSTYAVPVIMGEIKRLFRDGGTVKIGRALKELSMKASRLSNDFVKENGFEPQISYIAEKLSISAEDAVMALTASQPVLSLTASDEEGGQIDVKIEAPEERLSDLLSLKQVISGLEAKDRQLIILRYFKEKTQSDTAKALGMTQVQVSRREKIILSKLRDRLSEE